MEVKMGSVSVSSAVLLLLVLLAGLQHHECEALGGTGRRGFIKVVVQNHTPRPVQVAAKGVVLGTVPGKAVVTFLDVLFFGDLVVTRYDGKKATCHLTTPIHGRRRLSQIGTQRINLTIGTGGETASGGPFVVANVNDGSTLFTSVGSVNFTVDINYV